MNRSHKYYAKKTACIVGHKHPSKYEANYCNDLYFLVKASEIKSYEYEKQFDLHGVDGSIICKHFPDFYITNNDGSTEVHECKSKKTATPEWKLKKKLFEAEYKNIPYKVIWNKQWR